jgi:plastocyanin
MRTRTLSAALAVGVLAIAGCGSDDDGGDGGGGGDTGGSSGGSSSSSVRMSATDFKFTPDNPSVDKGTVKFTLTNDGKSPHALEVEGPSGEKKTPVIQAGKRATLEVDLNEDGTYTFYCPVGNHEQMGMKGEIKVGSGDGSGGSSGGGGGY